MKNSSVHGVDAVEGSKMGRIGRSFPLGAGVVEVVDTPVNIAGPPLPELPPPRGHSAFRCSSLPQVWHFLVLPFLSLAFPRRPNPFPEEVGRDFPFPLKKASTSASMNPRRTPPPVPRPVPFRNFVKVRLNRRTGLLVYDRHCFLKCFCIRNEYSAHSFSVQVRWGSGGGGGIGV